MSDDNSIPTIVEIQLSRGYVALVSPEDRAIADLKWCITVKSPTYVRATRNIRVNGKQTTQLMSRMIMSRMVGRELLHKEEVDHIDCNPLNNQRGNLRIATRAENQRNRGRTKNNASGHKGVYWIPLMKRWRAQVRVNGKLIHLGYSDLLESARTAYREGAERYHKEFARSD